MGDNTLNMNTSKTTFFDWNQVTPNGHAWRCPDCDTWATLAENAGYHAYICKHRTPELIKISDGTLDLRKNIKSTTSFLKSNPKFIIKLIVILVGVILV